MRPLLVCVALAACGSKKEAPPAPVAKPVIVADAGPVIADAGPTLPATDLLAAVPADAAFAFITLEPSDLMKRFVAVLDLPALRAAATQHLATKDPIAHLKYAAWLQLAQMADPWKVLGQRFAVYTRGAVVVIRVELADPAAARKIVADVMGTASIVDGGATSELVAVAENQLVVARGPREEIHAHAAQLLGAAATPLTAAAAHALGSDPRGVGWFDPKQLPASAFDDVEPSCRDSGLSVLHSLDRVTFGISELTASRITFVATLPVSTTTATALATASTSLPTLPATITPKPVVAFAAVAPPAELRSRFDALQTACNSHPVAAPWSDLRAVGAILYSPLAAGLQRQTDGFVAVDAPNPAAIFQALNGSLIGFTPPQPNGPFVPLDIGELGAITGPLSLALRGHSIIAANGPIARAHAGDFAPHDRAPFLRLFIDFTHVMDRTSPVKAQEDGDFYTGSPLFAEAAGLDRARDALIGALSFTLEAGPADVHAALVIDAGSRVPAPPRSTDPRVAIRDQCRLVLAHGFAAAAPALAKLEVVDDLEALETTYTTSIEAELAIGRCAKLTPAQRKCLVAANNVLVEAKACAPDPDGFESSAVRLPPLFSFFGPKSFEARFHPPVDGGKLLSKVVGTWVRTTEDRTETWKIAASGDVTTTQVDKKPPSTKTKHFKLDLHLAGRVAEISDNGSTSYESFFMQSADRMLIGDVSDLAPITSEDHFVVPLGASAYLVYDKTGCSVVNEGGALVAATCKRDKALLSVTYDGYSDQLTFVPGWIVGLRGNQTPFVRQP